MRFLRWINDVRLRDKVRVAVKFVKPWM